MGVSVFGRAPVADIMTGIVITLSSFHILLILIPGSLYIYLGRRTRGAKLRVQRVLRSLWVFLCCELLLLCCVKSFFYTYFKNRG